VPRGGQQRVDRRCGDARKKLSRAALRGFQRGQWEPGALPAPVSLWIGLRSTVALRRALGLTAAELAAMSKATVDDLVTVQDAFERATESDGE